MTSPDGSSYGSLPLPEAATSFAVERAPKTPSWRRLGVLALLSSALAAGVVGSARATRPPAALFSGGNHAPERVVSEDPSVPTDGVDGGDGGAGGDGGNDDGAVALLSSGLGLSLLNDYEAEAGAIGRGLYTKAFPYLAEVNNSIRQTNSANPPSTPAAQMIPYPPLRSGG